MFFFSYSRRRNLPAVSGRMDYDENYFALKSNFEEKAMLVIAVTKARSVLPGLQIRRDAAKRGGKLSSPAADTLRRRLFQH